MMSRGNVPLRILKTDQATVPTDTATALPAQGCHVLLVQAICAAGQTIYVGTSGVTTATGYPLQDGQTLELEVQNASDVYKIADAADAKLAYIAGAYR